MPDDPQDEDDLDPKYFAAEPVQRTVSTTGRRKRRLLMGSAVEKAGGLGRPTTVASVEQSRNTKK